MPDYLNQLPIPAGKTSISVPINMTNSSFCWEIEQIAVTYSIATGNPQVTITKNGIAYAPTALFVPGPTGQSQNAAGLPYLYMKSGDDVEIVVTGGVAGAEVTILAQYREYIATDPQVYGR